MKGPRRTSQQQFHNSEGIADCTQVKLIHVKTLFPRMLCRVFLVKPQRCLLAEVYLTFLIGEWKSQSHETDFWRGSCPYPDSLVLFLLIGLRYNSCTHNSVAFSIFTELRSRHQHLIPDGVYHPLKETLFPSATVGQFAMKTNRKISLPVRRQPLICFSSLWICLFWTFLINGITKHVALVSGFFHLA